MFVHIRGRGTYSMLEGIGSNASILQRAKELWQPAIALTDFNGVYGVVDFYSKSKWFEVQPLIGVELPYIPHRNLLWQTRGVLQQSWTLTYLALSERGYHNILSIVSQAYEQAHFDVPCVDNEVLTKYAQDVLVLIGGIWSYAYQALDIMQDEEKISLLVDSMKEIFTPERVVIDITAQSYDHYPILVQLDRVLLGLADQHKLMVVTSSGFSYPYEDQKIAYETALAIKDNKRNYDPDARKVQWAYHILSEDEVRTILTHNGHTQENIDLWTSNTMKIVELSHVKITLWQALFPNYENPENIVDLYEKYKNELVKE